MYRIVYYNINIKLKHKLEYLNKDYNMFISDLIWLYKYEKNIGISKY
jgi:hypothetical protein